MKIRITKNYITLAKQITLLVFILGCMYQTWTTFSQHIPYIKDFKANFITPYGKDFVSEYTTRFDSIHHYVKPNTQLGYFSEPGENYVYWGMHGCLTAYNIAPAIARDKQTRDTILYNLYNTKHLDASNTHLQQGWKIWKDFGNGLILLKK